MGTGHDVKLWIWDVPHRFMCLNIWSTAGTVRRLWDLWDMVPGTNGVTHGRPLIAVQASNSALLMWRNTSHLTQSYNGGMSLWVSPLSSCHSNSKVTNAATMSRTVPISLAPSLSQQQMPFKRWKTGHNKTHATDLHSVFLLKTKSLLK